MIRVTGPAAPPASSPARKAARAGPAFRPGSASRADGAGAPAGVAETETLRALIALQSGAGEAGARAKQVVAAQRMLDLLDRIRYGLVDGSSNEDDLNALALAASARPLAPEDDARLAALCDEIVLRARVELAKRGR